MRPSETVVVVCRHHGALPLLARLPAGAQERYVVASDDARVHEAAKSLPGVRGVCWIEQMESFYLVADDVIALTTVVNEWLKGLADDTKGFPADLLFFPRSAEGGMTTQRIQDLLLAIRGYSSLIDGQQASRLIIADPSGWEDQVMVETARARGLEVDFLGRRPQAAAFNRLASALALLGRASYYAANTVRLGSWARHFRPPKPPPEKEIVFQLCSSARKHVENIIPLMKALAKAGYNPLALCWHSNDRYSRNPGFRQVQGEGLAAELLEARCGLSDVASSLLRLWRTCLRAGRLRGQFLRNERLRYRGVPLGRLLWPSITHFLLAEPAQGYRFMVGIRRFFEEHSPLAIKLWGATSLREGFLAWRNLPRKNPPLVFFYAMGANTDWPYDEPANPIDLLFVPGEVHRRTANRNISPTKVEVCGQARYDDLKAFKLRHSREDSRGILALPKDPSFTVLFDHNIALRGFLSHREQALVLEALLDVAARFPSLTLVIKPHPSDPERTADELVARRRLRNVVLLDKRMSPYHALNAADVLVTKYSTIGIEAMLLDCPVVCCALDKERRLDIYKGASDFLCDVAELENLLKQLVTDEAFRTAWRERHRQRQKDFLRDYFCESDEPAAAVQARILDKRLAQRAGGRA